MKMNMYVIHDIVAQDSGPVFEAKNDGIAYRNFQKFAEKVGNIQDFIVYHVGTIDHDDNTISIKGCPQKVAMLDIDRKESDE